MLELSLEDAMLLVEALDNPVAANPKLQNALKKYQQTQKF